MEEAKEIVPAQSARQPGDTLRELLARQDLQPVAGATRGCSSEPQCMFSNPRPMNEPYQSYPLDWVMENK